MEEIALGEMGMSVSELWDISPRSLFNKLRGFRKLERDSWEQMRIHAWLLLQPYVVKGKAFQPQEILPLPWDDEIKTMAKVDAKKLAEDRKKFWENFDKENNKKVG